MQVGNEAARDGAKHSAVYAIMAGVRKAVPSAGAMSGVHYDKRGGKITIQYAGEDCGGQKDAVEETANKLCDQGVPLDKFEVSAADREGMAAFAGAAPSEIGGITVKSFACKAAKEQLLIEFIAGKKPAGGGGGEAKKDAGAAKEKKAAVKAADKAVAKKAPLSAYDDALKVSDSILDDVLESLRSCGVAVDGKEAALRLALMDKLETTVTLVKNCAYTNGYASKIPKDSPNNKPHFA
eukprot:CAMPEP_0169454314 /NCGR_PEP_ID=MMETSP1042-20121227/15215_1 /TAXON_ID=464988 /ORGANISM="Hemiselmis andersenii, Strain CCMP1180" /LENGTH=237 /DNA_ID=CAMNT_0009566385 /DNA_START=22 /DNA_END=735 /DNA_ORIENTATION=+